MPLSPPPRSSPRLLLLFLLLLALSWLPSLAADATAADDTPSPPGGSITNITDPNEAAAALIAAADAQAEAEALPLAPPPVGHSHEFGALNTLLMVLVLGLCILSAYLVRVNRFYYLPEYVVSSLFLCVLWVGCSYYYYHCYPYIHTPLHLTPPPQKQTKKRSAAAILVGLVVGGLARLVAPYNRAELDFLSFSPEIFFFLLLPPIIFEAG